MKISKIQISNILGIERLEYSPSGKITEISGQNASGKTSVLQAIKGALGGGHDATLLRKGSSEGTVVLEFDNGETLIKKMNRDKSSVVLEDPEGKKMKMGPTYLKEIVDSVGLNPIQILTADPKTRIKLLLDSVPMELPVDEIKFITGLDVSGDDRHPLKVIESKRKDIFEERADLNAEVNKQNTMISEMRKTIPFRPDGADWGSMVGRLRTALEKKNETSQAQIAVQAKKYSDDVLAAKDAFHDRMEALRAEDAKVLEDIAITKAPEIEELKTKITEADQNAKNQAAIKGAEDFVEKHEKEKVVNEQSANAFTEQLKSLDYLKAELLLKLPIEGLEVKDGDIYIKGVPFDTLNEAARIRFCLMIAGLRKTKLPLVCVDGLEALDETVFQLFKEQAEKTDMQFFVTRVSEDENLTLK